MTPGTYATWLASRELSRRRGRVAQAAPGPMQRAAQLAPSRLRQPLQHVRGRLEIGPRLVALAQRQEHLAPADALAGRLALALLLVLRLRAQRQGLVQ